MTRYNAPPGAVAVMIGALLLGMSGTARAQSADRDLSIERLPRPGYEPRDIIRGSVTIQPRIEAGAAYNSNVFALPHDAIADAVFNLQPSIDVQRTGTFDLHADAHANLIRYADHPRENVDTFGALIDANRDIGSRQRVSGMVAFDRTYERRSDPEARTDPSRPPALINVTSAELRYSYKGGRLGATLTAGLTDVNYLAAADADRDLTTYRGTLRLSLSVGGNTALYVEPFATRRQFGIPGARGGFGDLTTLGALTGISLAIGQRLNGAIGIGVFHANPDGIFASYTGVAVNGHLVWHPRTRTSVVFDAFRGDVATVRQGAAGRIDTTFSLSLEQEARHNLLLHAGIGYRNIRYRGGIDANQTYYSGELEARYLLNRYLTASLGVDFRKRRAQFVDERFDRVVTRAAIRFVY